MSAAKVAFEGSPTKLHTTLEIARPVSNSELSIRAIIPVDDAPVHSGTVHVWLSDPVVASVLYQSKRVRVTIETIEERVDCEGCDGTGQITEDGAEPYECGNCDGEGKVSP